MERKRNTKIEDSFIDEFEKMSKSKYETDLREISRDSVRDRK